MRRCLLVFSVFVSALLSAQSAQPAAQKSTPVKQDASMAQGKNSKPKAVGYIETGEPDFRQMIPPQPTGGSKQDEVDVVTLRAWQQPEDSPRWALAKVDADPKFSRFAEAFGAEIDSDKTPLLAHLLERTNLDTDKVINTAKAFFLRPRPYQRFQMEHVCGMAAAPAPDPNVKSGNSYPSGTAGYGWTLAYLLAEVAPERAQTLLARGKEYAESRLVCAAHFPSDVAASQVIVIAVIDKLHQNSEFQRDLACAVEEHAVIAKTKPTLSDGCVKLRDTINSGK